jgi:hypothetical protein
VSTNLFADERLQFFLRNRDEIKTWAAIENDVMAATREVLARSQPSIEQALLDLDDSVLVGRRDNGSWERILARRPTWPESIGLALEWNRAVDPLGSNRPKVGMFWWADPPALVQPRVEFVERVDKVALQKLGHKVPWGGGVWPVGNFANADAEWWRDTETWIDGIRRLLASTWPLVSDHVDAVLPDERRVSDG